LQPLVTICIPNYNKADFIAETIDSVYNQSYRNIELYIIDDGSTDQSVRIIKDKISNAPFKSILLQNKKNSGICYSLNNALRLAGGKYYQMLGSDDTILPDKINSQVNLLEKLPLDIAIVFGKSYRMDIAGNYLQSDYYESIGIDNSIVNSLRFEDMLSKNFISSAAHLVRMHAMREVGMYDESLRAEDWDIWLRLMKKYGFSFTNQYDSVYRIVPSSLSNNSKNFSEIYAAYSKSLLKHLGYSHLGNRNIAKNIRQLSLVVYKYAGVDAKYLLKQNFRLNKNLKSLVLYIASQLGIEYNFYKMLTMKKNK
jgi:alpha-1,3-rhamnosyltransferase